MSRAEVLVVDSGGFIKNAPLRELAGRLVTLQDVVSEIRDKETRQRMHVLPYDLEFRVPSSLGLAKVSEFAKKTGDFASLSLTDLNVLAVTWDLEVELRGGSDHLKVAFSSSILTLNHPLCIRRSQQYSEPPNTITQKKQASNREPETKMLLGSIKEKMLMGMRRLMKRATCKMMQWKIHLTLSVTGGSPYLRLILTFWMIFVKRRMMKHMKRNIRKMGMTLDMIQTRKMWSQMKEKEQEGKMVMMMMMTVGSHHQTSKTRRNSSRGILEGNRS